MPQAFKKYENEMDDGRRKLSSEQKDAIRAQYASGGISMMGIAREYGVSKKLILITVNQESFEKARKRQAAHWRDYYTKDSHREAIQKYREKKRRLKIPWR